VTLLDYIATDVVKSNHFSMKAKLIKAYALADIGMIREAMTMFLKASN
jgi:hypothetical protein